MKTLKELKYFIILWLTQSLSALGSAMTNFALVIWLYGGSGSALQTALLAVCSYAPYVLMSIFAGAISDRWNKKTVMLVCDSFAAMCTVTVLALFKTGNLQVWHLYIVNALNGLMNTVQQPASDVAVTMTAPKEHYSKVSAMRSFSNSLNSILTPAIAAAVMSFCGLEAVIFADLATFFAAFFALLFFIKIPEPEKSGERESFADMTKSGLAYLKTNNGILWLILFLAAINFVSSMYEAALAPMILSKSGEAALGAVNSCVGIAALCGSIIAGFAPKPKSRVKVICGCLMLSMSTENFFLAFGRTPLIWCIGAVLGWLPIPLMNANMDVIFRTKIPPEMQGRVYSARNTLQFFTIPLGYFLGGLLVDRVFEPFMEKNTFFLWDTLFGNGKGSGAAMLFFVLGISGVMVCLFFGRIKYIKELE